MHTPIAYCMCMSNTDSLDYDSCLTDFMRGRQMRSLLSTARWLLLSKMASPCSMDPPGIAGQSFTTTRQSPCPLITARAQWHNHVM